MSKTEKLNEEQVFKQALDDDELDAVAGGRDFTGSEEKDDTNCINVALRNIYGGDGFPNCASTVEDESWCDRNDACHSIAVVYVDSLESCWKAHA